jgi:hypothetical protein
MKSLMNNPMKTDIKPLCDKHLTEMAAIGVTARMGGSDVWNWPAFHCPAQGCTRLFDTGGHTTISNGSIDPDSRNFIGCDDGAMFIESVKEDGLIWRCSKKGCQQSRTTDRFFRPSGG